MTSVFSTTGSRCTTARSIGCACGRHTFACTCSRSDLQQTAIYPGTCRNRRGIPAEPSSVRLTVPDESIELIDLIQGRFSQRLDREVGDFVIARRDGIIAYQLAVVVDDAAQQVTQVVRGADLLDNTPRQLLLFRLLGLRLRDMRTFPFLQIGRIRSSANRLTPRP